jgi:iron(III)-salmochelin esterase
MRPSSLAAAALGLGFVALLAGVGSAAPGVVVQSFSVAGPDGVNEQAIAIFPQGASAPLPIVVAFHGKGESALGPARGYRAWADDYGLDRAFAVLLAGPLTAPAFGGLVRPAELARMNELLRSRPFAGVLVVGVYTPDLLRASAPELDRYARWVAHDLVAAIRGQFAFASRAAREVGVDGVSLGGMVALEVGLRHPEVFGAVGSLQPAIRGREAGLSERAQSVGAPQAIRLASSDGDPLLPVTRKLSHELRTRKVAHELTVYPGGHDYAFNRGPGAVQLLQFHDRALRAKAVP